MSDDRRAPCVGESRRRHAPTVTDCRDIRREADIPGLEVIIAACVRGLELLPPGSVWKGPIARLGSSLSTVVDPPDAA